MTTYEWEKFNAGKLDGNRVLKTKYELEQQKEIVKSYHNHIVAEDPYAFIALMDDRYYVRFQIKRTSLLD